MARYSLSQSNNVLDKRSSLHYYHLFYLKEYLFHSLIIFGLELKKTNTQYNKDQMHIVLNFESIYNPKRSTTSKKAWTLLFLSLMMLNIFWTLISKDNLVPAPLWSWMYLAASDRYNQPNCRAWTLPDAATFNYKCKRHYSCLPKNIWEQSANILNKCLRFFLHSTVTYLCMAKNIMLPNYY